MHDIAPSIVGWLVALGVGLALLAALGRPDPATPRCRRCRSDARPYAWHEPPRCRCGRDLSRAGAVRLARRRNRHWAWLAAVSIAASIGIAIIGARLNAEGARWTEWLPIGVHAWLAGWTDDSVALDALRQRIEAGLPPDDALATLRSLRSGAGADAHSFAPLIAPIFTAARSDPELAAWCLRQFILVDVASGADRVDVACTATFRVGAVQVRVAAGRDAVGPLVALDTTGNTTAATPSPPESRSSSSTGVADSPPEKVRSWRTIGALNPTVSTTLHPPENSRSITGTVTIDLEVRATRIWQTLPADVDGAGLPVEEWPWVSSVLSIEIPPPTAGTPGQPQQVGQGGLRSVERQLVRPIHEGAAPYVAEGLWGIVVGCGAAASILFAWAALRGRPGLAPPHCRRCLALLRGADDAVPPVCSECGTVIGPTTLRWSQRRRSIVSQVITVPIVFVGGVALAHVVAERIVVPRARDAYERSTRDPAGFAVHLLERVTSDSGRGDQRAVNTLHELTEGFESWTREAVIAIGPHLAPAIDRAARSGRLPSLSSDFVDLIDRALLFESITPSEADRLRAQVVPPPALVLLTHVVRASSSPCSVESAAPYAITVAFGPTTPASGLPAATALSSLLTPVQFALVVGGVPLRLTSPDTPGSADLFVQFLRLDPNVDGNSGVVGLEGVSALDDSRRSVRRVPISVVPSLDSLPAITTDPRYDPFDADGPWRVEEIGVTLVDVDGALTVGMWWGGLGGSLLQGAWEIEIDGRVDRLRSWTNGRGSFGVVAGQSLPDSLTLRYSPDDPPFEQSPWPAFTPEHHVARWGEPKTLRVDSVDQATRVREGYRYRRYIWKPGPPDAAGGADAAQ